MNGIICWICLTLAISVLQLALLHWQNELNKNQEKNVSQPNRDLWCIKQRGCLRSCRLQLHQTWRGPRMDIKILGNLLRETIDQGNLRDRHHQVIQKRIIESLRVGKLETNSQSWQTFDSDGAPVSNSLDGHDYSNFRTAVGKLIFMARAEWIKKVCWNSLVVVTQIGPAIRQDAKVQRDVIAMFRTWHCATGVWNRQRSVSVHAKQISTQPVLAQENCWDSQNSSRNFTTTFPFVSRWIQTRQDTFYSAGDQADSNTLSYDVWQYKQWTREKRLSVSRVDTKNNTEDLFTKHLDGLPTQSFAKKLGLRIPWYERRWLRNGDDWELLNSASSRAGV